MIDESSSSDDRESRTIGGPRLAVRFFWAEDRWSHAIEIGGEILARPVELPPSEERPDRVVSPTYQQINFQTSKDGAEQALLVGLCGPHHFAAVFTLRATESGGTLEIDAADRASRPVEYFAATYTVFKNANDLISADERSLRWSVGGGSLAFEPVAPARAALAEAGRSAVRAQALAAIDPKLKTQRIVYRWTTD